MKISFVVPAHNEEQLIARCLRSIVAEIERERADAEIIVVDNASSDRTADVAASVPGVRVIREERKGTGFARQAGLEVSTGELIATIDGDTVLGPGWIGVAQRRFERDPKLVGLSGPCTFYDVGIGAQFLLAVFNGLAYLSYLVTHGIFRRGSVMIGGNAVMRRSGLEKVGGFNTDLTFYGDDTDMAHRLSKIGKVLLDRNLHVQTSPRRAQKEGLLRTGWTYAINHLWTVAKKKPLHGDHKDIRE